MKEFQEALGSPWAIGGSFIFCVSGILFCIRSYRTSSSVSREAAEALQRKIEEVDRLQRKLMDKEDRKPNINSN
jgi:hypothetical protein